MIEKAVVVEKAQCILCGVCEAIAPHIFHQDTLIHVNQGAAFQHADYLEVCIDACPTECIKIVTTK